MSKSNHKGSKPLSLRLLLIVPFVLQISIAVGITGYLSLWNGQKAVNDLATQLMVKSSAIVDQQLNLYLAAPFQMIQQNVDLVEIGLLNLQDLKTLGRHFWSQCRRLPNVSYIYYTSNSGQVVGAGRWLKGKGIVIDEISPQTANRNVVYETDDHGSRTTVIAVYDYDPLSDYAYQITVKLGKPNWIGVGVVKEYGDYTAVNLSQPIFNQDGTLTGVMAFDLLVGGISEFLRKTELSPSGRIFIIERNGLLVGQSSSQSILRTVGKETQILQAVDSSDPLVRSTARYLQRHFGSFENIQNQQILTFNPEGSFLAEVLHQRQFVQVTPRRNKFGLDWLVITTVPESDFMAQINKNTHTTILLCLGASLLAIATGIYTSRWIIKPILNLKKASNAIASGELEQRVSVRGIAELEALAKSFNQMAKQLRESFAALEQLNSEQEQRVEQRTLELAMTNGQLQKEIHERKQIEQALQIANQELQQLVDLDGLTRIANRRCFDKRLQWEWRRLAREQLPLTLILLDVDYFKRYNDYYGHQTGDECLIQVAQALVQAVKRPADQVFRYGGEEFAVILPNTTQKGGITVAECIQQAIRELEIPHEQSDVSAIVSVSLGIASVIPMLRGSPNTLLNLADRAMYAAKQQGRNQYSVSS